MKIIGITALSISLMAGCTSAVLASGKNIMNLEEVNPKSLKFLNFSKSKINDFSIGNVFTCSLNGNEIDPAKPFKITTGYPNIKLYAKNTGTVAFTVEVKHNTKKTVIFQEVIQPKNKEKEFINNDDIPLVPSGDYTVTIYGGSGKPKGNIILKSSNIRWKALKN